LIIKKITHVFLSASIRPSFDLDDVALSDLISVVNDVLIVLQ